MTLNKLLAKFYKIDNIVDDLKRCDKSYLKRNEDLLETWGVGSKDEWHIKKLGIYLPLEAISTLNNPRNNLPQIFRNHFLMVCYCFS